MSDLKNNATEGKGINDNANHIILHDENIVQVNLPCNFLKCTKANLVILISRMLSFLVHINDSNSIKPYNLTRFHSRVPPSISVYNYLIRLTKYSSLEHCVLLSAIYYIDLLSSVYPHFTLNSLTVHRFILTATTVASKGLCDSFCTNGHYAKVGGVQCSELNILEHEFLKIINYRILPREGNINDCKQEHSSRTFSILSLGNNSDRGPNSGFNVLETYYRKIVQLVGDFNSCPDDSCKVSFILEKSFDHTYYHQIF